nr:RNA-directed DNA polymerase, eukaryota, reverse transcriptase zinc-binding domain protein [Tanacetum cinerariifolium]
MKEEEKLLFQKAKIKWLSLGDKNNAVFHRALKSRYSRNRVNVIYDEEGYNELFKKKLCKEDASTWLGMLQLVASILESIQVYWATVFLLPQTVIKEINRLLKGFLWNQSDQSNKNAKVAWKNLRIPKAKDLQLRVPCILESARPSIESSLYLGVH